MPETFIPLITSSLLAAPPDAFRARVLPQSPATAAFQALNSPTSSSAQPGHAHPPASSARPPVVTLRREGDRVVGIHIECSCGQIIELACS